MQFGTRQFISSFILLIGLTLSLDTQAQKAITLEDIWGDYKFAPNTVPGLNFQKDGRHYTRREDSKVQQYDITTGKATTVIFDAESLPETDGFDGSFNSYTFSADESKMLIKTRSEQIYRRSTRADFYIWDRENETLTALDREGKQRYATFSPDASNVAYVKMNNLYMKNLASGRTTQITYNGKFNEIINGATDWVYEEEFAIAKAFAWSPDGSRIAYLRFDESAVKEFTMTLHNDEAYPTYETFKYPKVGEDNAKVSVHIYDLNRRKTVLVKTGSEPDMYFPRIKWANNEELCVFKMNRHQNQLELLLATAGSGETRTLLKEENKYYIDITDDMTFINNGRQFIWTSERSGYNHIYLYDIQGNLSKQLTSGEFDVTSFYGIDVKNNQVFYQAAELDPKERQVYVVSLNGKNKKAICGERGWNSAQFSSTYDYLVCTHSSISSPANYTVYDRNGKIIRKIEENLDLKNLQKEYGWVSPEWFSFKTENNTSLNGWMVKPPSFNPSKKYPVFMYVYGGPGSQTVTDRWNSYNMWWFQLLAQQGYIVVSVDNRGTGARGEEFKKMTYLELGKYETIDQIAAAKYLGSKSFVDANRIGIFGWSYGGYMSSLCILKGNDVFKTAIAVAPVTNWKWYDTIYTERYMRTDDENPGGYKDNSPVYFADQLKGNYLIVHGNADDNVHFQNTAEMVNALIAANKPFDSVFYPNRNHGIYGGPTRLHLYHKMTNFLKEKL